MAATLWTFLATFAVPAPLFILVLLNLPLPRPFRRGILLFTSHVFGLPLVGMFKTLHVMLFLLAVAFGSAVQGLQQLQAAQSGGQFATPNYEVAHLSKRWRAERNLWLSGFAFTLWASLAAFHREATKREQLEDRLFGAEMSEFTATVDTARDACKEVSSGPAAGLISRSTSASPAKSPAPRAAAPAAAPRAVAPEQAPLPAAVEMVPAAVGQFTKKDQ